METCISQLSLQWQKTWDNQLNWTGFILASGFSLTPLGRTAPGLWGGEQHGGKWGIKWSCLSRAGGKQRQREGYWVFLPSMKADSQTSFQWATPPLAVTPHTSLAHQGGIQASSTQVFVGCWNSLMKGRDVNHCYFCLGLLQQCLINTCIQRSIQRKPEMIW